MEVKCLVLCILFTWTFYLLTAVHTTCYNTVVLLIVNTLVFIHSKLEWIIHEWYLLNIKWDNDDETFDAIVNELRPGSDKLCMENIETFMSTGMSDTKAEKTARNLLKQNLFQKW